MGSAGVEAAAWAASSPPAGAAAKAQKGPADAGVVLQVLGHEPLAPAWAQLIAQVRRRTSIDISPIPRALAAADSLALFSSPVLVWPHEVPAHLASLSPALLRRFLEAGGSLWLDGGDGHPGAAVVAAAMGAPELAPVAAGHVLFKTFYLLDAASPAGAGPAPHVEAGRGLLLGGRLAVWASSTALAPSWTQGAWEQGGPAARGEIAGGEAALRLGINWLMYALCLDYKDDQVHLPFILRRRH